jgi:hypothetical protein
MEKEKYYCRKCMKSLSVDNFYKAVDGGIVDSNGKFSVCKSCVQDIYDIILQETGTMEKTIHRLCTMFNVRFTNEALDATKSHVQTLMDNGKNVSAIFSIYLMKLIATKKSMDKGGINDFQYEDVGVIFTEKQLDIQEIAIPQEVIDFWGRDIPRGDIQYLEREYANFKNTHKADTYAEQVLLKQVCFTLLDIKAARSQQDDTGDLIKELQSLMQKLAISPNAVKTSSAGGIDTFGLWIQDIEKEEPAQWLKTDPRGDMYRDVANVEDYFQKFIVRPLKNFILGSRDFNVDEQENDMEFDDSEIDNLAHADVGEIEEE